MSKEVAVKKENDTEKNESINSIIDKLSPIERKVVSHLNLSFKKIVEKSGLEESGVIMALKYLEAKEVLKIETDVKTMIDLGTNGIYYKKKGLPERQLLILLETNNYIPLGEAAKLSKLSDNEFKAALGVLKKKALIGLTNGKISLNAKKEELVKKSLEEQFLDVLPLEKGKLESEQAYAFEQLKDRKDIVELKEEKLIRVQLTELGKQIAGKEITTDLLEEVTPEIIASGKGKKFRHYDVTTSVPEIYGGEKKFFKQKNKKSKKKKKYFKYKKIVENVKKAHESGVSGSKGWQYSWKEGEALKPLLRTHTTPLSAHTLARLKDKDIPGKFFAVGRCFRNETVDWSHGFEFNQTEGIVVDEKANFRHLLGYLKEFFTKMGYPEVKFVPSYFPY